MLVVCPQCRGERRYTRLNWPKTGDVTENGVTTTDFIVTREVVDCERCAGAGRCEATERIPVVQDGRRIGTVPPTFDPARIISTSPLYSPRNGDFIFSGEAVIAHTMLGNGDLEAVAGFRWEQR